GVQDIVLCPGGRNAPFVVELEKATGFRVLSFYDERSAGFFAFGGSQCDKRPVAVITPSGTAGTELISSAVEATYTETPLIFITADRPRKLRGTGAPQVIDQKDIFSSYVESSYDFEVNEEFAVNWKKQKPLHINVCFDEPHIEGPQEERSYKIASYQKPVKPTSSKVHLNKPLIVLSGMKESERLAVEQSLSGVTSPIYAESLSGLKNSTVLSSQLLKSGSSMVKKMMDDNIIDSILRIGDVPVGRFWRDLEKSTLKVVSLSSKNFQGLSHGELIYTSLESLKKESFQLGSFDWSKYQQEDHSRGKRVEELISKYPQSEVGWFNFLSQSMDSEDEVYLGNSLPIRIWDLVNSSGRKAFASRGVNGIDGQVSTALGH
ncbi:MAG: thiamine pyrophosphate-binding protein, partial [Bdellovibrionales bacterium]|nr:thiamine pyrophosphate-binding protein [Bdellovibrionales bacterium]